jgi:hypothetical protein
MGQTRQAALVRFAILRKLTKREKRVWLVFTKEGFCLEYGIRQSDRSLAAADGGIACHGV